MEIKKYLLLTSLLSCQLAIAATATNNFDVAATVEKTCFISADDVNFGIVNSPLTEQSANSEMKVLCSKDTLYKIDLKYGAAGSSNNNPVTVGLHMSADYGYVANYYTINGKFEGGALYCNKDGTLSFSPNQQIVDLNLAGLRTNESKVCNDDGTINLKNTENLFNAGSGSEYGTMKGFSSQDLMAYKFTLPNDSTKIWKANKNSFTSTGEGIVKIIQMNAKILPENSSSKYLAQDTYTENVIAEITY